MSNKIIVYSSPASPNAFRAGIYFNEKGLDIELVNIDMAKRENKADEYLARFPRGQVPSVTDGDLNLYESCAIMQYYEHLYPTKNPLVPSDNKDYATMLIRLHEFEQKLDQKQVLGALLFRKVPKDQMQDKIGELKKEFESWDKYLEGREWLAHTFSIADIAIFPTIDLCVEVGGLNLDKYPNLKKWYTAFSTRPSVKDRPSTVWNSMFGNNKNLLSD